MKTRLRSLFIEAAPWLVFGAVSFSFYVSPICADEQPDALKVKGALQEATEQLNELMQLRWNNGKIEPVVPSDREAVQSIVRDLQTKMGNGGSGSSSGGSSWSFSFNAAKMAGEVKYEGAKFLGASTFDVRLREESTPGRQLVVETNTKARLSIMLSSSDSPYVFRLFQESSGKLIVQEISGDQVFSQQEDSFADFCRLHVEFVRERLIPLLAHMGIQPPTTPYGGKVASEVRRLLKPVDAEELAKFKEIASGLDSDKFNVREKTAQELTKRFGELANIMRHATFNESYSAEVRSRFRQIIREKSSDEELRVHDVITKTKLTTDPAYLVWLMSETADTERAPIVDQLAKITGQKFGDESAQWLTWLKSQTPAEKPMQAKPVSIDLLAEKGKLQAAGKHIGRLVKLKWDGDRLRLDREHWAKPFGGKTIKQLSDEVANEVTKRKLPSSWWRQVNSSDKIGYPDVLFLAMQDELEGDLHSRIHFRHHRHFGHHGGGSEFEIDGLIALLATEKSTVQRAFGAAIGSKTEKIFKLRLAENEGTKRTLLVQEDEKKRLHISLLGEQSHSIVRLLEIPNGSWVVQDVRGTDVFAAKADSFRKLLDQNEDYFKKQFFPLLQHIGIVVPNAK